MGFKVLWGRIRLIGYFYGIVNVNGVLLGFNGFGGV